MKHHAHAVAAAAFGALTLGSMFCPAAVGATLVPPGNTNIQYMGHWDLKPEAATTNNSGSSILFGFTGQTLRGQFAPSTLAAQHRCEIYVSIDGGVPVRYIRDASSVVDFTPVPLASGRHTVELVVKDVDEHNNRWNLSLLSSIAFQGFLVDDDATPMAGVTKWFHWSPGAMRLEFLGDSITQGVRALSITAEPSGNDGTRDYAHLVGLAFDASFNQVGFGSQGITRAGGGSVPAAGTAFGFNFGGSPADPFFIPDAVVINQGTNDGAAPSATFVPLYTSFLQSIRSRYPTTWIFAMRPFNGAHAADISGVVAALGDPRIVYLDTTGWLSLTTADFTDGTVHPNVVGHAKAAARLIPIISQAVRGATPPTVAARMVPSTIDLRTGIGGLVSVVLTVPQGYTLTDVRGNGARAVSSAPSTDGTTYVATFQKSDLANVPAGNPVDFNLTGTLHQAMSASPFATAVPVRIVK